LPRDSTAGVSAFSPAADSVTGALHVAPPFVDRFATTVWRPPNVAAPSYRYTTLLEASTDSAVWPK
jgi:hypothetical protein